MENMLSGFCSESVFRDREWTKRIIFNSRSVENSIMFVVCYDKTVLMNDTIEHEKNQNNKFLSILLQK